MQPDCKGYDYYATSFAIPFYSLIWSRLAGDTDPARAKKYRERAKQNMPLAIHLFGTDGGAVPFGRSMTYRFACAAFWSAVAFDELEVNVHPLTARYGQRLAEVVKGKQARAKGQAAEVDL